MTGLQLWMLAGVLVMGGVACLVWFLAPAHPDLSDVLTRLSPTGGPRRATDTATDLDLTDRVGLWAQRHLPVGRVRMPTQDLALLGRPVHVFYGEKVLAVAIAVAGVPLISALLWVMLQFPLYVPVLLTVVVAVFAWSWPNIALKDAAAAARAEFNAALGAYIDLVALERKAGGSGIRQALENAARVGDAWPYRRIADALTRSRFAGTGSWDALTELSKELGLVTLDEFAGTMRMAGEESAQVYDTLRARSAALRTELLAAEQSKANADGERIAFPIVAMTMVFVMLLIIPALLRLLAG